MIVRSHDVDWNKKEISLGTFLAQMSSLSVSTNQDQKRTISKIGKDKIQWIAKDTLPTTKEKYLWPRTGQQSVEQISSQRTHQNRF